MNVKREPEAILAAWLDEGPTDLPDVTRRAILTALPTTPQARRGRFAPWRLFPMNIYARFAGAAFVAAVVFAGVIYVANSRLGPAATPATSPGASRIDTSTWETFTSRRYGLSFKVPPTWAVTAARRSGPGISSDELGLPGVAPGLMARSDPMSAGLTEDEWWTQYFATVSPNSVCRELPSDYGPTKVDGVTGSVFKGSAICAGYERAYVLKGGRVYAFTAITVGGPPGVDDDLFSAWLATIRLDPASADDSVPTDSPS